MKQTFANNAATIIVYKSSRKNARAETISINHLIDVNSESRKIDDGRILSQLIGTIEKLTSIIKNYDNHIEMKARLDIGKNASYRTVVCDPYETTEYISIVLQKAQLHSIEQAISYIYDVYCLVYPYNTLSSKTIFDNPSIRYYIKQHYHS
ncbi:MAG: hypothetical protein EOM05_12555 [Clostridia bacterium]|nr:hypothetical protein [Clostridia bacterium]